MSKKVSRKNLVKRLDNIFSQYIRLRNANAQGIAECYTCGKKDHWKKLQCGHFMSRKSYSTRWDEMNCNVQCVKCNMFEQGMSYVFGLNLNKDFGDGTAEGLLQKSKQIVKLQNYELEGLITKYTALVKKKMK